MKRENLEKANVILHKIIRREKQLEQLASVKEFTKITMKGENGAEKETNFNFDSDKEIVALIRNNIEQFLKTEIAKGTDELNAL